MTKNMPNRRFRVVLTLLAICCLIGVIWSFSEESTNAGRNGATGTLEKMIVANGSAALDVDLNRLSGAAAASRKTTTLNFAFPTDAFFTVQVFNNELRGPQPSSIELIPQDTVANLPARLNDSYRQLMLEATPWGGDYEFVVRDARSGFVFFNIEGQELSYQPETKSFSIANGRALVSSDFAAAMGRPAAAGTVVGTLSMNATMRPIEVTTVVDGEATGNTLPPTEGEAGTVPGPDVIVGELSGLAQFGSSSGTQVGLAVGTDSCNRGIEPLHWFANPANDHPVIPQNLYRMSGGSDNTQRFEQIGQSSVKHAFTALQNNICNFGCVSSGTGSLLGSGCSDPYGASLNSGPNLGSRAWINPYTGFYPRNDSATPNNNHNGHNHLGPSHRVLVEMNDLNTTMNPGASYYTEAQYITPHEYAWCQANPGQCNMHNNASYRKYNVSGTTSFSFSAAGNTVRMQPAINAWPGATLVRIEPAPGEDGIAWIGYKVTHIGNGVYHYEYALYNQNLDRAIQSFTIPLGDGSVLDNIGFHAPPQHPGWSADGTMNNAGYSNQPWIQTSFAGGTKWSSETIAQNPNGNAVRWGTLYNIRFDSTRPPEGVNATIEFFKTGAPMNVIVLGPALSLAPPPCTSRIRPLFPTTGCGP